MLGSRELVDSATKQLQDAGLESASVDAWLLLTELTHMSRWQLLRAKLRDDTVGAYRAQIAARAKGTPVQHLTGKAYFRHIEVAVGPGVFIPRPETELVAEQAINGCEGITDPWVAELCAGSGAISKSILDEVPNSKLFAVEISDEALPYLKRNIGADSRARILHLDFNQLPQLFEGFHGCFDVVVANPPYIPDQSELPVDVLADPQIALFGGSDGLDVIRKLLPVAIWLLKDDGVLAIEHDETQHASIVELAGQFPQLIEIVDHNDLTDRPRFLVAKKATGLIPPVN